MTDDVETEGENESEIKPKNIQCEEDDEFVKMFDSLMTTEQNVVQPKNTDLNIPMNLKAKADEKQEGTVVFSLITRKGNKANAKGNFIIKCVINLKLSHSCARRLETCNWSRKGGAGKNEGERGDEEVDHSNGRPFTR